ncbi:calcium-dependent protein kinase 4-like [Trifolium medium]|uniref:Calcium-dependent protein kinase 4-like n=1 Tax=Trifolium medium TaxID=97028 RepID=A0A392N3R2_9FABA|nr:calcium-dependent protein kinase 4-like [Trifolium medium]
MPVCWSELDDRAEGSPIKSRTSSKPFLDSKLLLPQTNLGGDLYSNTRRKLIDAMTVLPCLTTVVFSSQVELRA